MSDPQFRFAFLEWVKAIKTRPEKQNRLHRLVCFCDLHPRKWAILQHAVVRRYERETGIEVGNRPDWQVIFAWFKEHGPSLIEVALAVLQLIVIL